MDHINRSTRPLRRAVGAALAAVAASAVVPATAFAQASPPPPVSVDEFCAVVPAEDEFTDVSDESWAPNVRCLAYADITQGIDADSYGPERSVTREQMASFVTRMYDTAVDLQLGNDDPSDDLVPLPAYDGTNRFDDVSATSDHVANINRLAAAGIAEGGPYGLTADDFGPDLNVTRDQMASFITRALERLTGVDRAATNDYFPDDERSVHEANINALAEVGIVVGYDDGLYHPRWAVTRAQMAAYLIRPLASLEEAGVIAPLPPLEAPVGEVSAVYSTADTVDNENGTATISFTVRDAEDNGVDGLTAEDFSLVVPGQTDADTVAELLAEAPATWTDFTDAEAGEGVYTVLLDADAGTYTYTDIAAAGTVIDDSLTVTITG